jgi:hypothetical protein
LLLKQGERARESSRENKRERARITVAKLLLRMQWVEEGHSVLESSCRHSRRG